MRGGAQINSSASIQKRFASAGLRNKWRTQPLRAPSKPSRLCGPIRGGGAGNNHDRLCPARSVCSELVGRPRGHLLPADKWPSPAPLLHFAAQFVCLATGGRRQLSSTARLIWRAKSLDRCHVRPAAAAAHNKGRSSAGATQAGPPTSGRQGDWPDFCPLGLRSLPVGPPWSLPDSRPALELSLVEVLSSSRRNRSFRMVFLKEKSIAADPIDWPHAPVARRGTHLHCACQPSLALAGGSARPRASELGSSWDADN